MYQLYANTFETIHDFFRGEQRTSTQEIAQMIRGVAKYVDGQNLMEYRMYRLQELVYELHALAVRVRNLADSRRALPYSRQRTIGYR